MSFRRLAGFLAPLLCASMALAEPAPLSTIAEQSGFVRTGRHDEVVRLCAEFAKAWPDAVRCIEFGRTPEDRPMLALVAGAADALTPEAARAKRRPVLLMQGGIHAGEIDGKDAGFLFLRELLNGRLAKGALDKLTLVFVPVFNVDGHERFGAWNRPNQRGPEQMGWRTTAQNFNLNRDYMKAGAPEMQAMLRLIGAWDPIVYADLHVTNGAQFEHDISITMEPVHSGDPALRKAGLALRTAMLERLSKRGSLPLAFYPSFVDYDNPASGFADGVAPPRFSTGYMPLRNRFGILVETHSWKDYPTRVRATHDTILALVELAMRDGARWSQLGADADARAARLAGKPFALAYKAADTARTIDFRGYAYTRTPSAISGALVTRYDENTPQVWKIPLRDDVQPALSVDAPRGGYVVPAAWTARVGAHLDLHGIAFRRLDQAIAGAATQTFRATSKKFGGTSVEGRQTLAVEGEWKDEPRDIPAGSLFVPIEQAKSRLVVALFEPQAPDSFAAWGDFNAAFEQKEYMEAYVAEDVARAMLESDEALRAEFVRRLAEDPAFAASPDQRLEFFARRHASWDERRDLYPVMRIDAVSDRR